LRIGTTSLSAHAFDENNKRELDTILLRALLIALSITYLILILQQYLLPLVFILFR